MSLDAEFVKSTIPKTINAYSTYHVKVIMKNTGEQDWKSTRFNPYYLDLGPDLKRVKLPVNMTVPAGKIYPFAFDIMKSSAGPGSYYEFHVTPQMSYEDTFFGTSADIIVGVLPAEEDAVFTRLDIPSTLYQYQPYGPILITVANYGQKTWTDSLGYGLMVNDQVLNLLDHGVNVKPGNSYVFNMNWFHLNTDPGVKTFKFQMCRQVSKYAVSRFGQIVNRTVLTIKK